MAALNRVFLIGNLTFDPELKRTASGLAVTTLRMAINRSWTGRDGEKRDETLYIDIDVWDRQAENCCQYLRKGSSIHVEGSLKMDTWDDKNSGEKRSKIKVSAERIQFLDRRDSHGGGGGSHSDDESSGPAPAREAPYRRSAPVPSSSTAETRSNGNGSYRGYGSGSGSGSEAVSAAPKRPSPPPETPADDVEDDDIPF